MIGHGMGRGFCSGWWGSFGGWGGIGPIINLALTVGFLIGVVLLVIWAVRRLSDQRIVSSVPTGRAAGDKTALEILNTRYAKGEISREEFQAIKDDLTA